MVYSKELREWAALLQSNIYAAQALKERNGPHGAGSTIRALMVEVVSSAPALGTPVSPTQRITEKLWDDIDKQTDMMQKTLPAIINIDSSPLPDPDDIL